MSAGLSLELAVALFIFGLTNTNLSFSQRRMQRLEHLPEVPPKWRFIALPDPSRTFRLHIALRQQNRGKFEQTVINISTPSNPRYGKHMSLQEIKAMLRPKDEAINGVLEWLQSEGVHEIDDDNDWIHATVTIGQAENLLRTNYNLYQHSESGKRRIRTLGYSVPANLRKYIDMIQPTTMFNEFHTEVLGGIRLNKEDKVFQSTGATTTRDSSSFNFTACNTTNSIQISANSTYFTPQCIRHLYDLGDPQSLPPYSKAKFGITAFNNESAKYSDLADFLKVLAPYAVGTNFTVVSVNGGLNNQNNHVEVDADLEANIDIQWSVPIAYPVPVTFYSVGNSSHIDGDMDLPDLDFFFYLMNLPDDELPQTVSTSYGQDERYVPPQYAWSECNLIAQLGARGVSILYASGDSGVGSDCETVDGTNRTHFVPTYPATCPFVTGVGATHGAMPEQAVFFSGGGFSDYFPRPEYQDDSVEAYLKILGNQWRGLFNPTGRAVPDVAAQGTMATLIEHGQDFLAFGTSVSCPIFSSVIALLNEKRMENGLPGLGFLNPWLYSVGKTGLNDIIFGGSTGCTSNDTGMAPEHPTPFVPFASWNATPGWDPVTGLGTPDYQKLLPLSMAPVQY